MSAPTITKPVVRRDVPAALPTTTLVTTPPQVIKPAPAGALEVSPQGTKYRPSRRTAEGPRGGGADWDNARAHFRAPTIGDWMVEMRKRPEIFTGILSDIFRETQAEKRRLAGRAKIGRRPRVIDGSLDDLWAMITPQYAKVPFVQAVTELVKGEKATDIAQRTGITESTVKRMLLGQDISMWRLEAIARAYGVSPAYFLEWRRSYVLTVVEELLTAQPGLSVRYAKALAQVVGA